MPRPNKTDPDHLRPGLAAQQFDERDRQMSRIVRDIEKLLPNPLTFNQRCFIENAIILNLNGADR